MIINGLVSGDKMKELSQRENEIIELLISGYDYNDIAKSLRISARTVHTYIERIINKLQASNKVSAVANYMKLQYEK